MRPRFNLWIEREGRVVLSTWRVRLLVAVEQTGSITAAAERMQVPYRRAWERIQEMERRLDTQLVRTEVGGAGGGGATLSPEARELVQRFQRFEAGWREQIEARFQEAFGGSLCRGAEEQV
jgi:molybdate transport system regulatory protein